MVTISTKDVGKVRDKFIGENYKWILEEGNEEYIKREMGIDG